MVRTQVYLTPAQYRALKKAAAREGVSMTELLRRLIDLDLRGLREPQAFDKEAVLSFVGLGSSGYRNTAERHDEALDEVLREGTLR